METPLLLLLLQFFAPILSLSKPPSSPLLLLPRSRIRPWPDRLPTDEGKKGEALSNEETTALTERRKTDFCGQTEGEDVSGFSDNGGGGGVFPWGRRGGCFYPTSGLTDKRCSLLFCFSPFMFLHPRF